MIVHETSPGSFVEETGPNLILDGGARLSLASANVMSDAALAAIGRYRVQMATIPEGKIVTGYSFAREGNAVVQVLETEDAPNPVPGAISPLQARRALRAAGYKAAVDGYVATLDEEQQEAWEYATEIRRDNAIIAAGAAALGLTEQQVDDLFRAAAAIAD